MAKKKRHVVEASKGNNDYITFNKEENGMISIHLGYEEVLFTVKECKDIILELRKCILE